jgi:uncharacterized protein YjiS (DUF1127 family)
MSTPFSNTHSLRLNRRRALVSSYQSNSWSGWAALLHELSRWGERRRLRAALRDLAEDQHLLDDIGLTRQEAIDEATKPFWR